MKTAAYYLMYALRRFTRAGPKNALGEFQAQFAMLWVEGALATSLLSIIFERQYAGANPYLIAAVVLVPLFFLNRVLFSVERREWRDQCANFASLTRQARQLADVAAGVFFLASIVGIPVLAKWLRTGAL